MVVDQERKEECNGGLHWLDIQDQPANFAEEKG
ncbi:MAG: hypothetical protein PWQ25_849 [Deferribacteres bacterium]|jgi:hypothetical protein|nr:hypothetical protein [Deferribacteraceae bacterium]MDK2791986.1 hypothetical protein [Deferribacteres bacterium]